MTTDKSSYNIDLMIEHQIIDFFIRFLRLGHTIQGRIKAVDFEQDRRNRFPRCPSQTSKGVSNLYEFNFGVPKDNKASKNIFALFPKRERDAKFCGKNVFEKCKNF